MTSRLTEDFLRDDAGSPLGPGMPSGARGLGTVHGWINIAGACSRCNGSKRDLALLVFLYRRRWQGHAARPGEPVRALRRCAGGPTRPPPTCGWAGPVAARASIR